MIIVMDSMKQIICNNFNRLVDESGMKHKDLADRLKVTAGSFAKWRSGIHPIDPDVIDELAGILHVDRLEFYKGAENVVPMYGNSSIRKAMIIPDEVIEGLYEISGDEKIWEQVKLAIRLRKEAIQEARKSQAKE